VISRDGTIAYKHIGPVSARDLDETILPLIDGLRR
jgi:cytochrome c biogenesis protein CcmG/thiol:disulfide interchange protein DsbE